MQTFFYFLTVLSFLVLKIVKLSHFSKRKFNSACFLSSPCTRETMVFSFGTLNYSKQFREVLVLIIKSVITSLNVMTICMINRKTSIFLNDKN